MPSRPGLDLLLTKDSAKFNSSAVKGRSKKSSEPEEIKSGSLGGAQGGQSSCIRLLIFSILSSL